MMFTDQLTQAICQERAQYPESRRASALVPVLHRVQQNFGWLSPEDLAQIAQLLDLPLAAVWETASFYPIFNLRPTGKYRLVVCTGLPCALSGATHTANYLKQKLGIGFGETTADGKFTLLEGECMGACDEAPVLRVQDIRLKSRMHAPDIDRLIAECV
jgi:NADH-quinone oxidoreductase subunit E